MSLCVYVRELPVRGTPPALPLATAGSLTLAVRTSSESFVKAGSYASNTSPLPRNLVACNDIRTEVHTNAEPICR